jgi:hypothetical protein
MTATATAVAAVAEVATGTTLAGRTTGTSRKYEAMWARGRVVTGSYYR